MDTDRARAIAGAARELFVRQGYRKTSMVEIAAAAGISRPTLYALFPDRAAIFSALFSQSTDVNVAETKRRLQGKKSVRDRVRAVLDIWFIQPYVEFSQANAIDDLIEAAHAIAPEAARAFWAACVDHMAVAISPGANRPSASAAEFALILVSAARTLKSEVDSEAALREAMLRVERAAAASRPRSRAALPASRERRA